MAFIKNILILFYLSFLSQVFPFDIVDPKQKDVHFGDIIQKAQNIEINEKNPNGDSIETVTFAKLTNVKGELEIQFSKKCDSLNNLNIQEEKGDESDIIYLKANYIDYETIRGNDFCLIRVNEVGKSIEGKQIKLIIVNLDDEPPMFETSPCTMKENTSITVDNSECVFAIVDFDGSLPTMQFQFDTTDYDNLFTLEYKTVPDPTVKSSNIYLTLKDGKTLNYDEVSLYSFGVTATDQGNLTSSVANVIVYVQNEV